MIRGPELGPKLGEEGYYVGRVEGNLYRIMDEHYQCAFMTTCDGVVLFDAPAALGHKIQRAVNEIAAANGVSNKVTYLIYSHHHADHIGASSRFGRDVVRIGHEETRKLLLRDDDPARPAPEETFQDLRTLDIGGERIDLIWHGSNHSSDNIFIHLPRHAALMLVDIVNPGWAAVCQGEPGQRRSRLHPGSGLCAHLSMEAFYRRPHEPGRDSRRSCNSSSVHG